jgi:hypothetical protein
MGLSSRLFARDKKLEACQVNDQAHLVLGTKGPHVAKVQLALFALDWLVIDRQELCSETYGPSTSKAVLAYKTKRKIINYAYQNKPDNIVGKMTITRLDQDMCVWERMQMHMGDCILSPRGTTEKAAPLTRSGLVSAPILQTVANNPSARTTALPQLGRALRIYCSITKKASLEDGFPLAQQLEKAKDRLFEYGLTLSVEFGASNRTGFGDSINFPYSLVLNEDVGLLRKVSEDTRPGFPKVLRIIVCPRSPNADPGETFRNVMLGNVLFPPFVVLNSKSVARDNATLLHEMIHAAYDRVVEHDGEPHSIFFRHAPTKPESWDRTWLKPERAIALSKGFFAA